MPETPPNGMLPLYLRGATLEKFHLKIGESLNDLVAYLFVPKEDIMKDIQVNGKTSDFEPGKKQIDSYTGDKILIYIDRDQKYGEVCLICYTNDAVDSIMSMISEQESAIQEQLKAELLAEEERRKAEEARLNVVYEDKPITPRPYVSVATHDTDSDVKPRDLISIEVSRPKRFIKQSYRFGDRNADVGGVAEFRAYKDPNFKQIREVDNGIQVAPLCAESAAQTTWYRSVNKAVQYESASVGTDSEVYTDSLLTFLEKATIRIEQALQQNEAVDLFSDTFRPQGEEEGGEVQTENELRELKNFADANYSKSKALVAIDWMPKTQGMVAVSAVRNISFDQRIPILGQTHASYVMLWDFRLLVKPLVLMQSHHEVFTFRFNRTNPNFVAGGCITGQILLWEVNETVNHALRKNNRGSAQASSTAMDEDEDLNTAPLMPKYVSSVDHSHKKCVADLFWLPPTTQINYRGQIVAEEHLDGVSHQFVTVAPDGLIMVWDTRFEKIYNDELRHIGRSKHVPTEKSSSKEGGHVKPLWAPIFKAHLKRLEGVGELSLCRVSETTNPTNSSLCVGKPNTFPGDSRAQFIVSTEEGDLVFADLSARKTVNNQKEEDEEEDNEVSCVKWITIDHARPAVYMQESPFFPQIILTVSDWSFHIWKLGEDQPLFVSPLSTAYLTAAAWSTTRPAVFFIATADGQILVWDFTDSGFRPSIELKATHSKITSMELLAAQGGARFQMMAVGDEAGTLHIFEMPRNLTKPVHKEESIMLKFLERELQRIELERATRDSHSLIGVEKANKDTNKSADDLALPPPPSAAPTKPPPTATAGAASMRSASTTALDPALQAMQSEEALAQSKEEEEFLKLEQIFISELGLDADNLPSFVVK